MGETTADHNFLLQAERLGILNAEEVRLVHERIAQDHRSATTCVVQMGLMSVGDIDRVLHALKRRQAHREESSLPETIAGYRILDQLGKGGMGTVYRAEQMALGREVALKVLSPRLVEDEDFVARFIREARSSGRINHPHVVACYDVGRDGDLLYMAQELVAGGDVGHLMSHSGGRLDERRALTIVEDCLRAIEAIDDAGLIHRDIKPTNIFLDATGRAKLGDLGLARTIAYDDRISQSGEVYGTPAYMSPEHAQGHEDLDVRTDIYSLAASLYCMLTGRQPYEGRSSWDVVSKVLHDPVPDPGDVVAELSRPVRALVMRGMAKERELRHQDPVAMRRDVRGILDHGRVVEHDTRRQLDHGHAMGLAWRDRTAVLRPVHAIGQGDRVQWDEAMAQVFAGDPQRVVVDCSAVEWISSEGLATFVRLHETCAKQGLHFIICALNRSTDQAIRCVYLDRLLIIVPDLEAALQYVP